MTTNVVGAGRMAAKRTIEYEVWPRKPGFTALDKVASDPDFRRLVLQLLMDPTIMARVVSNEDGPWYEHPDEVKRALTKSKHRLRQVAGIMRTAHTICTERQVQVLSLWLAAHTYRDIGRALKIHWTTVAEHLHKCIGRLRYHYRSQ